MFRDRLLNRLILVVGLILVSWSISACYKDAGENVQPTSNRVDLSDIAATTPAPTTPLVAATPTTEALATSTKTLVPTTTPAGGAQDTPTDAAPTQAVESAEPTSTPRLAPTFTPALVVGTPTATEVVIATPGMSDIQPSATPTPTRDLTRQPTPTSIPVEQNPCIHVVQSGDTLYSIAQDTSVLLADLVAANPSLLGGNPNAILQIGWQLQIPGCGTPTPTPGAEQTQTPGTPPAEQPTAAGGPVTHVVQPGEGIYSIARKYGVDPQAIINANHLANPNLIHPGDTLIIPASGQ